jgi:hypothetical protein
MMEPPIQNRVVVPSVGWRADPWIYRLAALFTAGLVATMAYVIVGPPTSTSLTLVYILLFAIVVVAFSPYELMASRYIVVSDVGVEFSYPMRKRAVPWANLRLSSRREPSWFNSVTFLESRGAAKLQRAHRVTRAQASAILSWMPSSASST